eukprot:gene57995-biopygen97614
MATAQSSSFAGGASGRAVDGDATTFWRDGSCTHTEGQTDPWWRVDLGAQHNVCTVRITNRADSCCTDRLNGFEVRAGQTEGDGTANHNCGNGGHATVSGGATVDVGCGGQLARYVNVRIPGEQDTLTVRGPGVRMHNAHGNAVSFSYV